MNPAQIEAERPPEGLARGRFEAPRPVVLALGAAVLLGALIYLFLRLRRAARSRSR